jgi:hypothetical protein
MQNKYVFKNILLFVIICVAFVILIAFINNIKQDQREPFVSKMREGYRNSIRGTRNIVRNIYKYGYMYTSKLLRM